MASTNGIVAKARALCVPGQQFDSSARAIVLAAAAEILRDCGILTAAQERSVSRLARSDVLRPADRLEIAELADSDTITRGDARVIAQALRLATFGPSEDPRPPADPALEKAISEAFAVEAAAALAAQQALDTQLIARAALDQTNRTPYSAQAEARAAELVAAEEGRRLATEAWQRARAARVALEQRRAARDRMATLEAATRR